jgi:hypothetical protein
MNSGVLEISRTRSRRWGWPSTAPKHRRLLYVFVVVSASNPRKGDHEFTRSRLAICRKRCFGRKELVERRVAGGRSREPSCRRRLATFLVSEATWPILQANVHIISGMGAWPLPGGLAGGMAQGRCQSGCRAPIPQSVRIDAIAMPGRCSSKAGQQLVQMAE